MTTDRAPAYPRVLDELVPEAWHVVEQYANNPIEADHGRFKARLRPMRGLHTVRSAQVVVAGMRSSRTCAADTTNSEPKQPAYYESPLPSANSPERSIGTCTRTSVRRPISQRNSPRPAWSTSTTGSTSSASHPPDAETRMSQGVRLYRAVAKSIHSIETRVSAMTLQINLHMPSAELLASLSGYEPDGRTTSATAPPKPPSTRSTRTHGTGGCAGSGASVRARPARKASTATPLLRQRMADSPSKGSPSPAHPASP